MKEISNSYIVSFKIN